jgi:hypothetical protein
LAATRVSSRTSMRKTEKVKVEVRFTAAWWLMMSGRDIIKCREPTYRDRVICGQDGITIVEYIGRVRGKIMIARR